MAQLRRLIGVAGEIAEAAYSLPSDVPAVVDHAEALVFAVGETNLADTVVGVDTLLSEGLDYLEALYQRGDTITGTPTGFYDLDRLLSGLHGGDLVVLGARPAVGKSAFALDMARHIAFERRQPTLLFSLEMSRRQITQRLIAAEARIELTRVRNGRLTDSDWPKLSAAVARINDAPFFVDDQRDVTITALRAKARRLRSRLGGLGAVIVDYVQLMQAEGRSENRQIEVAQISRGLEDPRRRTRRARRRPIPDLPQRRAASRQTAHPGRPARKRRPRSRRRRRHPPLPRRALQRGQRRPRHRRDHGGQTTQRAHRHRTRRLPGPPRPLRQHGPHLNPAGLPPTFEPNRAGGPSPPRASRRRHQPGPRRPPGARPSPQSRPHPECSRRSAAVATQTAIVVSPSSCWSRPARPSMVQRPAGSPAKANGPNDPLRNGVLAALDPTRSNRTRLLPFVYAFRQP